MITMEYYSDSDFISSVRIIGNLILLYQILH